MELSSLFFEGMENWKWNEAQLTHLEGEQKTKGLDLDYSLLHLWTVFDPANKYSSVISIQRGICRKSAY